jgi:triosephosphate isomerase
MRAAKQFVEKQLMSDLKGIDAKKMRNIIVAYEPIWAIGTGKNETPEGAAHMVAAIKRFLLKTKNRSPKVLYGGSVNGRNISGFLREHAIDGVLVGGASIIPREFRSIIVSAAKHSKR